MAAAAAGRNADLPGELFCCNEAVQIAACAGQLIRMRGINALQHFRNVVFRPVNDLFHTGSILSARFSVRAVLC